MENIHIIIGAVALALINPLWSKYQIEKEKKTKKREGVKVGAFLVCWNKDRFKFINFIFNNTLCYGENF